MTSHFQVTGHFETSTSKWRQMTLNTKRSKNRSRKCSPYIHITTAPSPKFQSVLLYRQPFRVPGHFETSSPNAKILKEQKYSIYILHMHIATTPEPQMSLLFKFLLKLPQSPKFYSSLLCGQAFSSYRQFWDKYTGWPQNNLKHKVNYLCCLSAPRVLHSILVYD